MTSTADKLSRHYRTLERRFGVRDEPEYEHLVVPNGSSEEPFHRWFHLKEAFDGGLLGRVIEQTGLGKSDSLRLLDPFAGVGTSLVSALSEAGSGRSVEAYGIERNPFLQFVAQTKTLALLKGDKSFAFFAEDVLQLARRRGTKPYARPRLSTFAKPEYFDRGDLDWLLRIRAAIGTVKGTALSKNIARLALAASIEPVSSLRRDGRALRFHPEKVRANPLEEFARRAQDMARDLSLRPITREAKARVYLRDGRRPQRVLMQDFQADVILFSPPYPNNIDYTEVYKMEAWLLGFIATPGAFRRQRLRTLRSHPSVRFPDSYVAATNGHRSQFDALIEPLLEAVPATRQRNWRLRLIRGYFDDMLRTLLNHRPILEDGGILTYVVGNSLHGADKKFLIAADLLIAGIGEMAGYRVESFGVARRPVRRSRNDPLLRESVVILRKAC